MNAATTTITPGERALLVRRNTILLACCQGLAAITFPVLLIVGSVAVVELTGRDSSAGVMNGVYFLSAAGGAFLFGRAMDRLGRRVGLLASYLLLSAAGGVCALGTATDSFPILLVGAVVFGAGFSGANLARAAVADMYEPAQRGRAVGIVLAVSTIGAVGSPFLIAAVRAWAEGTSFDPEVVPWVIVPVVGLWRLRLRARAPAGPRGTSRSPASTRVQPPMHGRRRSCSRSRCSGPPSSRPRSDRWRWWPSWA